MFRVDTGLPGAEALAMLRRALVVPLLWPALLSALPAQERPNVVVLVADDLGWGDVGWHAGEMRTPRLDALVREGIELDRHYVQPQCTPTRVALLTGRYPSRFGAHCTRASNERALPPGTATMASVLRGLGYATGLFGKWHLGSRPEWGPNHYGFEHSHGSLAGAVGMYDHRYRPGSPHERTWHRDGEFVAETGHATDLVTDAAIAWLAQQRGRPFFLYVPFHSVHVPLVEEQRWIRTNAHVEDPDRRLFAAAVSHLDDAVGRIVGAIDGHGLRERTLVLFLSDNGGLRAHAGGTYPPPDSRLHTVGSNAPLRGFKSDVFEGGIRVPAFVRWPGRLAPGRSAAVVHAVDWLPTLCALLGAPAPERIDGRDVLGAITGAPVPRRLYWQWGRRLALLDGDWKVLRNRGDGPFQLFRLDRDPGEQHDLAAAEPDRLRAMLELLRAEVAGDAEPIGF